METSANRSVGRLLVTGVPGWLTAAFLEDLARRGLPGLRRVRCLVEPGAAGELDALRARLPLDAELVVGDLRDPDAMRAAAAGVDTVLHSAGVVHVRRTRDWYDVNTLGTQMLLQAALLARAGRFVLLSSNAAAGRSERFDRPLVETDPPRPLSHYGRSKWLAEKELFAWSERIEAVVLRPCMFYGPPVPPRHIEVYRRILDGRMPLVGGGHFARSLSHIDNLVQGCRLALAHPAAAGQTYYITDRPVYTTFEIVEAMGAALGCRPRYVRLPGHVGRMAHLVDNALAAAGVYWQTVHLVGESDWHVGVSCEKARRELGYRPTVELAEGMRQSVDWCVARGLLERPRAKAA